MPHDHRMRPTGDNHRPTPRIVRAITNKYNRSLQEGAYQGMGTAGVLNSPSVPQVDESYGQMIVDSYRKQRARAATAPDYLADHEKAYSDKIGGVISQAVRERNVVDPSLYGEALWEHHSYGNPSGRPSVRGNYEVI